MYYLHSNGDDQDFLQVTEAHEVVEHVPPDEHLYYLISERTFLQRLDTSHLIKGELVSDQIINPENL